MSANVSMQYTISPDDAAYPAALRACSGFKTAPTLTAIGNLELLSRPAIALFCSAECPSDLIPKIYSLAEALRDAAVPVISGFHTSIEQGCWDVLLQGSQPIIQCPARSIHRLRLSPEQQGAIEDDRLLLLSPFSASYSRMTAELANKRNAMIGAIASAVFIGYAAPQSKTLAFAQGLIAAGKAVMTIDGASNAVLQEQGIAGFSTEAIIGHVDDLL